MVSPSAGDAGGVRRVETEESKRANAKIFARAALTTEGTPNEMLEPFEDSLDGQGAWEALMLTYDKPNHARAAEIHRQLHSEQLAAGEHPREYFARIEGMRRRLVMLGGEGHRVSDEQMVNIVLSNLGAEYRLLRATVVGVLKGQLTYDQLKEQTEDFYSFEQLEVKREGGGASGERAMMAVGDIMCQCCGGRGHRKDVCPSPGGGGSGSRKKTGCWICGDPGHKKVDCPKKAGKEDSSHLAWEDDCVDVCM